VTLELRLVDNLDSTSFVQLFVLGSLHFSKSSLSKLYYGALQEHETLMQYDNMFHPQTGTSEKRTVSPSL
jgi:hypothetical protein